MASRELPPGLSKRGDCKTYRWERQYKGHTYKESVGALRDRAIKRAVELNDALVRGDIGTILSRRSRVPIASLLDAALERRRDEVALSPRSMASFQNRIRLLCAFLEEEHPSIRTMNQLTPAVASGYIAWRRSRLTSRSGTAKSRDKMRPPSGKTVSDDVRRFRTLFKQAIRMGLIADDPFKDVRTTLKAKERMPLERMLYDADIEKLLKAAHEYDRSPQALNAPSTFRGMFHDMIAFYLFTGLRKEELVYLPWEHVDLNWGSHGRISIAPVDLRTRIVPDLSDVTVEALATLAAERRGSPRLFRSVMEAQKTLGGAFVPRYAQEIEALKPSAWCDESNRLLIPVRVQWEQKATRGWIPLFNSSRAIIDRRREQTEDGVAFVFAHPDGGPLKSDPLPVFKQVLKAAGLPQRIRLHDLRHTYAFTLRDKGVPLETIMGLMRHSDIQQTLLYAPYRLEEGAKRIQVLGEAWRS